MRPACRFNQQMLEISNRMTLPLLIHLVDFCRRRALWVVLFALASCVGLSAYIANNIKINTDINQLMASDLDWREREQALEKAFPQNVDRLVIVIDGISPDAAEAAADSLAKALRKDPSLFKTVKRPDAIPYFQKNGLLFLSEDKLTTLLENMIKAQPFLGSLARDLSLRGLFDTMALSVEGIRSGMARYEEIEPSLKVLADTLSSALEGRDEKLPWQSVMSDQPPALRDLRKFILTQPVLDYSALSPGKKASQEVRRLAETLDLTPEHGVQVRLTGSIALNDEEFASVANGMEISILLSFVLVIALLYLALRSTRLILPILLTLVAGLLATTSFALFAVGSLNLISVAFAVMFVGIAVDFGIQFGVRFRQERFLEPDFIKAIKTTAQNIAPPLALAAASTTLGFLAFIPTDYRGVSELGVIASAGMVIAFILNLTLLPSLLALFKPPAEKGSVGYAWAAPIDIFLLAHRRVLLIVIGGVSLAALVLAAQIRFDFDPLNLKNPETESVSTMLAIMEDPDASPYTIEILAPDLEKAQTLATKLEALPEVDHAITLASFVPKDQAEKLALIADAQFMLAPSLSPADPLPAPTREQILKSMDETALKLRSLGTDRTAAAHLAKELENVVASQDPSLLNRLHVSMIDGMQHYLLQIKQLLSAAPVTLTSITDDLRRDWITPEGCAKIEVYPKGNGRDPNVLQLFADSVRQVEPEASGTAISIQESGKTVLNAFIKAGLLALGAIAALAFIILRRLGDVLRLLFPLILAGVLTLATMVAVSLPFNFANIIALPLLLSLGVSYAIYFVTYWRNGHEHPLGSSMARAVLFSAGTTLVAFGSLSLSSHPGTQGMGELLTIALLYSVLCTFLVLPVLLGRLR